MDTTTESSPGLIPIGEAARLLGVSVDTIRRWEAKGLITATRTPLGNRRFELTEVRRLKEAS